jgi:toxin ParE1/3/4
LATVVWTEQAVQDLDSICLFLARDAPRYADLIAARVFRAIESLEHFPESGRVVPEIGRQDIRELIIQNYRLTYRIVGEEVQVIALHHGARLLRELDLC